MLRKKLAMKAKVQKEEHIENKIAITIHQTCLVL